MRIVPIQTLLILTGITPALLGKGLFGLRVDVTSSSVCTGVVFVLALRR